MMSVVIYSLSLWVHLSDSNLSGNYKSVVHSDAQETGHWSGALDMTINQRMLHSRVFFESEGADGIALFEASGEIMDYTQGIYRYHSKLTVVHEAKIQSVALAKPYTNLLFNAQHDKVGALKMIYYDGESFIADLNPNNPNHSIFLFVKK